MLKGVALAVEVAGVGVGELDCVRAARFDDRQLQELCDPLGGLAYATGVVGGREAGSLPDKVAVSDLALLLLMLLIE